MLPLGHASAGYAVAAGILSFFHVPSSDPSAQTMLWYGFVFGAIPDLDMFAAFLKTRSWVIQNEKQSHRRYITHTPLFWGVVAGVAFLFTHNGVLASLLFFAPFSHLLLDSLEDEIRWFWPLSKKSFCMIKHTGELSLPKESFFSYWTKFCVWYVTKRKITAICEIILIVCFVVLFFFFGKR